MQYLQKSKTLPLQEVDEEKLFSNLVYFLEAIGPVCEKYDIRMGIHPDDPAWPIFGLPRIITDKAHIEKFLKAVDKPYNGLTLCTGSLGSNQNNDIPGIIEAAKGRIAFAHVSPHSSPGKKEYHLRFQLIRSILRAI